ncbi:MAG: UbiA family prenyltransferase [Bacteroidetes bacterium]|nr:UbiA family prenyltransferase [Bacteroidota bacterium]MBS1932830.1 UbiA family prenyltransferase [Bacteroidota bacterium]
MVYQTHSLLLTTKPSADFLLFVFFSTICSYNFHWYLTPVSLASSQRVQWAQQHKGWHLFLYFIGLIGSIVFFFRIRQHWFAISFSALLTFLYSAPKLPQVFFKELKRIAIGKTIFLSFVWMYVTTVLPVIISGETWKMDFTLFSCSRLFLIYAICILFDYRDRADDKNDGIKSMITYFNERGINNLFTISLSFFALTTVALYWYGHSVFTVATLLVPGIIVAAIYNIAKKNFSDYLYYFVLDGLMMLSGLLMLIERI